VATPKLFLATAQGTLFPMVTISMFAPGADANPPLATGSIACS